MSLNKLVNRKVFLFALCFLFFAFSLSAQDSVSLQVEIQNIERSLTREGITPQERHSALVRLARLRQLSGDIETAARNWLEAAAAIPGRVDHDALLASAICLAVIGEFERASLAINPILNQSPRARFLNASINAARTGDTSELAFLAGNPQFAQMRSEIYFLLMRMSNGPAAEVWRQRLIAEAPASPEGRLALGENTSVIVNPSPFWFLIGRQDTLLPPDTAAAQYQPVTPAATAPATPTVAAPAPVTPAPVAADASTAAAVRLQTGIFSRQDNAQAQAGRLRTAGFSPSVEQRTVNGNQMWAVTVPGGLDTNRTITELRGGGFEAFPLR